MSIPIDRLIRSHRKTIAVIVRPDGELEVRTPLLMPDRAIQVFVDQHADWIRKQQARALRTAPPPAKSFTEGEKFLYLGKSHALHIVTSQRLSLKFDGTTFHLAKSALPKAGETFAHWYKGCAREAIPGQVQVLASRYSFSYQKIRISSARTRWGSCSSRGTLSFTWRLMMAPPEIVNYVIIHELVHTKVPNHSKTFWSTVAGIMPDFKVHRTWLRKNGKYLTID